jgi:very-short-patch-repair endonuclease
MALHDIEEVKQNDQIRQQQLEQEGLSFLRFSNDEIKLKLERVIQQIETYLKEKTKKSKDS